MKRILLISIAFILCLSYAYAEENYNAADIKRIDVKKQQLPILIDDEWEWVDFKRVPYIVNEDIYSFFRIKDVETPLEKRAFERTQEYQDYLTKIKDIKKVFLSTFYGISFDLQGNIPYDVERDCFTFRIGYPNDSRVKRPNYIFFEDLCVSLPSKYVIINQQNISGYYSLSQFVLTSKVSEELALQIDKGMKQRECPYDLMFVVKFDKLIEKQSALGSRFNSNYLLTKAVGLFIYDVNTNSMVVNFDSICKEPVVTPKPKPKTGTKTGTRTGTRTTTRR